MFRGKGLSQKKIIKILENIKDIVIINGHTFLRKHDASQTMQVTQEN